MDLKQLTKKQRTFLDYIIDYKSEHGVFPTYREICDVFGYKSPNSVTQNIDALLDRGYLNKEDGKYLLSDTIQIKLNDEELSLLHQREEPEEFLKSVIHEALNKKALREQGCNDNSKG